jgi:hypothetical protein
VRTGGANPPADVTGELEAICLSSSSLRSLLFADDARGIELKWAEAGARVSTDTKSFRSELSGVRTGEGEPIATGLRDPELFRTPKGSAYMTLTRWPDWGGNSTPFSWSIAAAAASMLE